MGEHAGECTTQGRDIDSPWPSTDLPHALCLQCCFNRQGLREFPSGRSGGICGSQELTGHTRFSRCFDSCWSILASSRTIVTRGVTRSLVCPTQVSQLWSRTRKIRCNQV